LSGEGLRHAKVVVDELRLTLGNTLDAVEAGRAPLIAWLDGRGFSARALNRLEVVFEELVSNTVRHGFAPGSAQTIRVGARILDRDLTIVFEDDGRPFDPLQQEAPPAFSTPQAALAGGLGIQLVRRLAASVRYERPAPTGSAFSPVNRITVVLPSA
jgi:serine/threonine-protein kinase RsbW